jgi:hypothetical protein
VNLVGSRGAAAQLCVLRGGEVVLDRAFGCAPTSLFRIFGWSQGFQLGGPRTFGIWRLWPTP